MGLTETIPRRLALAVHLALSVLLLPVGLWLAPAVDRGECVLGELEFGHVGGLHGEPEWTSQDSSREPARELEAQAALVSAPEALSHQGDDLRPRVRVEARHAQLPDARERRTPREALFEGTDAKLSTSLYLEHRSILC